MGHSERRRLRGLDRSEAEGKAQGPGLMRIIVKVKARPERRHGKVPAALGPFPLLADTLRETGSSLHRPKGQKKYRSSSNCAEDGAGASRRIPRLGRYAVLLDWLPGPLGTKLQGKGQLGRSALTLPLQLLEEPVLAHAPREPHQLEQVHPRVEGSWISTLPRPWETSGSRSSRLRICKGSTVPS